LDFVFVELGTRERERERERAPEEWKMVFEEAVVWRRTDIIDSY
jgi:hypothetical protein